MIQKEKTAKVCFRWRGIAGVLTKSYPSIHIYTIKHPENQQLT